MAFNINDMKQNLRFGGARPNLFEVTVTFPPGTDLGFAIGAGLVGNQGATRVNDEIKFKVTSANIPPATVGIIQVPYFGRFMKLPGDRTFPGWQVNVINDEDFRIRDAFERWSNSINELAGNKRKSATGPADARAFKTDARVIQYGKTGNKIREYEFIGLYPTTVGEIALDWASTDQIEIFPVLFEYDYWKVSGGTTGRLEGTVVGDTGRPGTAQ